MSLPEEAVVCFANTGKEDEATLKFVDDCAKAWNVKIHWLEYQPAELTKDRWKEVDFETASRDGEPFEALIRMRNYLPNPVSRFCTVELKVRTIHRYLKSIGWKQWTSMHGNCDLCYLKGGAQILSLIAEKPERALWWARMESVGLSSKPEGGKFRTDRPSYAEMLKFSEKQRDMFDPNEATIACFCGD